MNDEEMVNEARFRAIQKGMVMLTSKLYEIECRIAELEKEPREALVRVKMDFHVKKATDLPPGQTRL